MQFLVQTSDAPRVDWSRQGERLREESTTVYRLWKEGTIRHIWFTEAQDAVMILECPDKASAHTVVKSLPLVKNGLLQYTLTALSVYSGFDRLIERPSARLNGGAHPVA